MLIAVRWMQRVFRYCGDREWPFSAHLIALVFGTALPMASSLTWAMLAYASAERHYLLICFVGAGFVLFSIVVTTTVCQGIRSAMDQLVTEAEKLAGDDTKVIPVRSRVCEINRISKALDQACANITERRRIKALLMKEVDHRVKNSMATTLALARNSFLPGEDAKAALKRFEGRLMAMAKTHDVLVGRKWAGADLGPLVKAEMRPYGERVLMIGPAVTLSARMALSLSLALHELAVNAVKYGALSNQKGTVEVRWCLLDRQQEGSKKELHLLWTESGGPPIREPKRKGFGSRLIKAGALNEMTGSVIMEFRPVGLHCRIIAPIPDTDPANTRILLWQAEVESVEVLVAPGPKPT